MAKVVGKLTAEKKNVSGLIVKKGFSSYQIMAPDS